MNRLDTQKIKLTAFSHGGGCGCKLAPAVLAELLAKTPLATCVSEPAGRHRVQRRRGGVPTQRRAGDRRDHGFFHAHRRRSRTTSAASPRPMRCRMSMPWAATPIFALAIVGMPLDKLPVEVDAARSSPAAQSVCDAAGIPIAGGHSIDSSEPIYGLVALGLVHPDQVKRNDRAQAGDVLILGKPLGVGILSAALKKGELRDKAYRQMLETTTQLNTPGIALARNGWRACDDRCHRLRLARAICWKSAAARSWRRRLSWIRFRFSRQRSIWPRPVTRPAPPIATGTALKTKCDAAAGHARVAAQAVVRSADQRRVAGRVRSRERAARA